MPGHELIVQTPHGPAQKPGVAVRRQVSVGGAVGEALFALWTLGIARQFHIARAPLVGLHA